MQHYKYRNPPWVKLYSDLLDDPAFRTLSSCDVGVYAKLLLIASRCANCIAYDAAWLRKRYGISTHSIAICAQAGLITISDEVDLDEVTYDNQPLEPTDASGVLADCVHPDSSEERENRERTEKKTEREHDHGYGHGHDHNDDHERDLEPEHVDASKRRNGSSVAANASPRVAPRNLSRHLPRMPNQLRKGSRLTTDFESINDAVEKLIKRGGLAPEDYGALATVAGITQAQAAAAVQQLRDRGRI